MAHSLDLILGQNLRKQTSWRSTAAPDTDSNFVNLTVQGTNVVPDLQFSHNFLTYISQPGNSQTVTFQSPIRIEDRSLVVLILDNSNNTANKVFNFTNIYDFLDDVGITSYTILPGQTLVWYGTTINGRVCLAESIESTLV
jgi:hypothetical protein